VLEKIIAKKYGDVLRPASQYIDKKYRIINVSPAIDYELGGGIPEGSFVILSGPPKGGKSSTALQIAANAQKMDKKIFYDSVENRIKERDLHGVYGLNLDSCHIIESTEEKILTGEEHLSICEDVLKNEPGCVLIIDSTSTLCGETVMKEGEIRGTGRNSNPKMIKEFCNKNHSIARVNSSTVIMVQHLICNTSGYGPKFMEDGGTGAQFHSDVKLRCKSFSPWINTDKKRIGQIIEWAVVWSAIGPPGGEITSYLRYGHGLDAVQEIIELCTTFGIITKSGSWYLLPEECGTDTKIQGQEKIAELIGENPTVLEILKTKLKELS
jgi:recombination protein RecA